MTKFLIVDPDEMAKKYRYKDGQNPFVDFEITRRFDTDLIRGFKGARNNNQTILAMTYLEFILDRLEDVIDERTQPTPEAEAKPKPAPKQVTKSTEKQSATTEELSD